MTRDLGRMFLGRNMQCAQCHDSPIVDDYKQEHYYGLMAFFDRSCLVRNANAATAAIGEKADGEVTFTSVFDKNKVQNRPVRRSSTARPSPSPNPRRGRNTRSPRPPRPVQPVPTHQPPRTAGGRAGETLTSSRNAANRMWALMLGRGLSICLIWIHGDPPRFRNCFFSWGRVG